jgi:hypothetical protein
MMMIMMMMIKINFMPCMVKVADIDLLYGSMAGGFKHGAKDPYSKKVEISYTGERLPICCKRCLLSEANLIIR